MARATLTPLVPGRNGSVVRTSTALVVVDGQQVAAGDVDGLLLIINNASGGAAVVTIQGSDSEHAWLRAYGDLTVNIANGATAVVGPFETARFEQDDGMLYIDSDAVVLVTAVTLP
jgi:hypothetical protein